VTAYLAGGAQGRPTWLKLTRVGATVTGAVSSDGQTWSVVGSTTVAGLAYTGLVVTSGTTAALSVSTFDSVAVTLPTATGLPTPWTGQDIGAVGVAGSATATSGSYTVAGAGLDIWGTADAFRYVSQPLAGDGVIVARVTALQNTHANAKAGLMMRGALSAGAQHVMINAAVDGSVEFISRSTTGAVTAYLAGGAQGRPTWLKLTRVGATVTGAVSSDGQSWSAIGSTTVAGLAYTGLVVTSGTTAASSLSTFDSVVVTSGTH
jgi:hypothetical protein